MTDKRLIRIQAISGILFSIFLVLHLLNTALAAWSHTAYNAFQAALRPIYQYPAVEFGLILLPLTAHIYAGISRMVRRRGKEQQPALRMRLHRWSAWFLLLVIGGHILATRGSSLVFGVYPEFQGVGYALWWQPIFFYPYYLLLALLGLYHGINGLTYALSMLRVRYAPAWRNGKRFWVPVGAAAIILTASVFAFGGLLYDAPSPTDHDYARLYEKHLGVELPKAEVVDTERE